ncbi:MAG: SDR family NAD(P)-dependent oxidoreductase [Phenylobacterium sp.]|uniref:SDR family NAD(P)-dependent oxidoreductase n=1 Tax=Phenylobacterium sp. TaxID=1871053 RepID=UPI002735964F|nr:SDR family NAD(P)-dependent oxidoreductase [Phenylobacterium sp.]MDP3174326.1 SDR family NAD(P)-dependent oxidoreductase [Phenylobacterium sp.]
MSAFKDALFDGKTVFVAGGTSGINLGIAKRLGELGARVAVAGRNPEKAAAAAAQIGGADKAMGLSCDVRDYDAVRAAMVSVTEAFGPLDIVVSGAAGNFLSPASGLSSNAFRTVVDIDLNGTFNVFRGSYDLLRKPGASLIAITAGQAVNARLRGAVRRLHDPRARRSRRTPAPPRPASTNWFACWPWSGDRKASASTASRPARSPAPKAWPA